MPWKKILAKMTFLIYDSHSTKCSHFFEWIENLFNSEYYHGSSNNKLLFILQKHTAGIFKTQVKNVWFFVFLCVFAFENIEMKWNRSWRNSNKWHPLWTNAFQMKPHALTFKLNIFTVGRGYANRKITDCHLANRTTECPLTYHRINPHKFAIR